MGLNGKVHIYVKKERTLATSADGRKDADNEVSSIIDGPRPESRNRASSGNDAGEFGSGCGERHDIRRRSANFDDPRADHIHDPHHEPLSQHDHRGSWNEPGKERADHDRQDGQRTGSYESCLRSHGTARKRARAAVSRAGLRAGRDIAGPRDPKQILHLFVEEVSRDQHRYEDQNKTLRRKGDVDASARDNQDRTVEDEARRGLESTSR